MEAVSRGPLTVVWSEPFGWISSHRPRDEEDIVAESPLGMVHVSRPTSKPVWWSVGIQVDGRLASDSLSSDPSRIAGRSVMRVLSQGSSPKQS